MVGIFVFVNKVICCRNVFFFWCVKFIIVILIVFLFRCFLIFFYSFCFWVIILRMFWRLIFFKCLEMIEVILGVLIIFGFNFWSFLIFFLSFFKFFFFFIVVVVLVLWLLMMLLILGIVFNFIYCFKIRKIVI